MDKMRLWVHAYAPDKRSLVELKNAMIMGLYNTEMKKTCLFLPKDLQHESEIKAVSDHHQLVNLRTYNTDLRAPSQDMADL